MAKDNRLKAFLLRQDIRYEGRANWNAEGAWAYRYPAKVSRHLQLRLEKLPAEVQAIGWKAQVRLASGIGS